MGICPGWLKKGSGRTAKSPHELRDLFRSQWAKSPANQEVAEFMMGHMIDPLEYNKSYRDVDFYRHEYLKALPLLQIMSSPRPFGQVDEEEVDSLRREVEKLRTGKDDRLKEVEDLRNRMADMEQQVQNWKQLSKDLEQLTRYVQARKL